MKNFPIMNPGQPCPIAQVPMFYVAQFERQAQINHSQSVTRLAERGGLTPKELYGVVHGLSYRQTKLTETECIEWLVKEAGLISQINSLNEKITRLEIALRTSNDLYHQKILKLVNCFKNMKATVTIKPEDFPILQDSSGIMACVGKTYTVNVIIYSEDGKRYFLDDCPLPQWHERYLEISYGQ